MLFEIVLVCHKCGQEIMRGKILKLTVKFIFKKGTLKRTFNFLSKILNLKLH